MKTTKEIIAEFKNVEPINEMETKVLEKAIESAISYGEGPYFIWDEAMVDGLTINQLKGYIAQLTKKGYLYKLEGGEYYFDTEICIDYQTWMNFYE